MNTARSYSHSRGKKKTYAERRRKHVCSKWSKPPRFHNQRPVDNLCLHCIRLRPIVCASQVMLLLCCLCLALCRLTVWLQDHESLKSPDCKLIVNTEKHIEIWRFSFVLFICVFDVVNYQWRDFSYCSVHVHRNERKKTSEGEMFVTDLS